MIFTLSGNSCSKTIKWLLEFLQFKKSSKYYDPLLFYSFYVLTGFSVDTDELSFIYKQRNIYCCTCFYFSRFQCPCSSIPFYTRLTVSYLDNNFIRQLHTHG